MAAHAATFQVVGAADHQLAPEGSRLRRHYPNDRRERGYPAQRPRAVEGFRCLNHWKFIRQYPQKYREKLSVYSILWRAVEGFLCLCDHGLSSDISASPETVEGFRCLCPCGACVVQLSLPLHQYRYQQRQCQSCWFIHFTRSRISTVCSRISV